MSQVVIGDILPRTQATATGGQTVYSTNWTADAASDVVVYSRAAGVAANDITQVLSYPSQYSVAFIGAAEEVQVTLVTPSTAADIVTVIRQTPADRENLYSNTNFLPTMLNTDFGILTLVDQQAQLVDQLVGPRYNYSAIINPLNTDEDTILPILGANQVWAKNPGNTAIIPLTISSSGIVSGTINIGLQNQLAYYATNGTTLSGLTITQGLSITGGTLTVGQATNIQFNNNQGIQDSNGKLLLNFRVSAGAVNYIDLFNAGTGVAPILQAAGTDTNILFQLKGKGTSGVGIQGTSTNDSAVAGNEGEFVSSQITAAGAVSLTSPATSNVTSISLTAGDWDAWGNVGFLPNAATTTDFVAGGISIVSATLGDVATVAFTSWAAATNLAGNVSVAAPYRRLSLATTTTVYLCASATFGTNIMKACGGIFARRAR